MRSTTQGNRWEVPTGPDPANYALQLERLALQYEEAFSDLEDWSNHMAGSNTEVGSPAIIRERNSSIGAFGLSIANPLKWTTTTFDNTGSVQPLNSELVVPDQDQRYWWWAGLALNLDPIQANGRYTMAMIVQDYDAASGYLAQSTKIHKQYMLPSTGTGDQYMMLEGLFRSGGGRFRGTLAHNNTGGASINVLTGSSIWAVRICPAR